MKQIDWIYNDSPEKKQTSSYSSWNKSSFKEKGKHSKVDSHGDLTETYNSKEDRPSTKSLIKSILFILFL